MQEADVLYNDRNNPGCNLKKPLFTLKEKWFETYQSQKDKYAVMNGN